MNKVIRTAFCTAAAAAAAGLAACDLNDNGAVYTAERLQSLTGCAMGETAQMIRPKANGDLGRFTCKAEDAGFNLQVHTRKNGHDYLSSATAQRQQDGTYVLTGLVIDNDQVMIRNRSTTEDALKRLGNAVYTIESDTTPSAAPSPVFGKKP